MEAQMSAKDRIISGFIFGALMIVVVGCKPTNTARVDPHLRAATDFRKAELEKELQKKYENPTALYELGQLYHASGDWLKADWYYDQAISFNPVYRDAQVAKVKMQLDKGDKSKSEYLANMYIAQVASSPEQLLSMGVAFEKQGLDNYALKCYQDAMKLSPDSYKVSRQLGYYYLNRNKKDLAREYFVRSFQLNGNQPDVAGELGRLGVAVKIPEPPAKTSEKMNQSTMPPTAPD
jgi:tetratricopeptide (TPR) repeat protein